MVSTVVVGVPYHIFEDQIGQCGGSIKCVLADGTCTKVTVAVAVDNQFVLRQVAARQAQPCQIKVDLNTWLGGFCRRLAARLEFPHAVEAVGIGYRAGNLRDAGSIISPNEVEVVG